MRCSRVGRASVDGRLRSSSSLCPKEPTKGRRSGCHRRSRGSVSATTVLLWRIYFYSAGELETEAAAAVPGPVNERPVVYAHSIAVAAILGISVSDKLVIGSVRTHTNGLDRPHRRRTRDVSRRTRRLGVRRVQRGVLGISRSRCSSSPPSHRH
jgi:hypothetical protein